MQLQSSIIQKVNLKGVCDERSNDWPDLFWIGEAAGRKKRERFFVPGRVHHGWGQVFPQNCKKFREDSF
jgi:hypothetical protein